MFLNAIRQAIDNIIENARITFLAIITSCFSLVILGTFILVYLNLIHLTSITLYKSYYSVFLNENIDSGSYQAILGFIENNIDGVADLTEISSEDARKQLIESFVEAKDLLAKVEFPEFPRIIEFTLDRPGPLTLLETDTIKSLEGVRDVITGRDTREQIDMFFAIASFVGVFLIALLVISIILIIHNSIQLSIRSRIEEIEILKTLGASNGFVRFPFIIEGIVIALVSFLVAIGIIYLLYQFVIAGITYSEATYTIRSVARFFSRFELLGAGLVVVFSGIFSSSIATGKIFDRLDTNLIRTR